MSSSAYLGGATSSGMETSNGLAERLRNSSMTLIKSSPTEPNEQLHGRIEALPEAGYDTPDGYDSDEEWEAIRKRMKELRESSEDSSVLLQLSHDRICWLERKLRKLPKNAGKDKRLNAASGMIEATHPTRTIPEVRRVEWFAFKNSKFNEQQPAIEVLIGRARYYYESRGYQTVDGRARTPWDQSQEQQIVIEAPEQDSDPGTRQIPERIRINSTTILAIFSAIDARNWPSEPTVLLRPYRFLVYREAKLRHALVELAKKWSDHDDSPHHAQSAASRNQQRNGGVGVTAGYIQNQALCLAPNNPVPAVGASGMGRGKEKTERSMTLDNSTDSLAAFRDLRCLMEFYDQDVKPVVDALRDRTARRVRFSNLWYLYNPGELLYQPLGNNTSELVRKPPDKAAVYQDALSAFREKSHEHTDERYQNIIRHVASFRGRPILCPDEEDDKNLPPKKRINELTVYGYMIEYDGTKFGQSAHSVDIQPFEGDCEITSLAIYPLAYHENKERLLASAIAKGKKYLEFDGPRHYNYAGPTWRTYPRGGSIQNSYNSEDWESPKQYDHIEGPVIIDFKETLRLRPFWQHPIGFPSRKFFKIDPREQKEDERLTRNMWDGADRKQPRQSVPENVQPNDFVEYQRFETYVSQDPFLKAYATRNEGEGSNSHTLTDMEFALLPNRAFAFFLRNREFVQIMLDDDKLQRVGLVKDGFNNLKLRKGHKQMVKSLVRNHFEAKKARASVTDEKAHNHDLVKGRGLGLVILLHGAPGTGKTSTAECVAELTGKPLLTITCGDLGLTADEVERSLQFRFNQAQLWNCVLLLDEADVFLAARNRTDLKRNSIVAVFLRVLEYYNGILFLTTNRVGAFDEAFKSRIHMSLYYPPLGKQQTLAIWGMNLNRLKERLGDRLKADSDAILEFANQHYEQCRKSRSNWNGRQIRNAFQTASALAEYDAEELRLQSPNIAGMQSNGVFDSSKPRIHLTVQYFQTVAEASQEFDDYLEETNRGTAGEVAYNNLERSDHIDWNEVNQPHSNFPYRDTRAVRPGNYSAQWTRQSDSRASIRQTQHSPNPPPPPPPPRWSGQSPMSDDSGFSPPPTQPGIGERVRSPSYGYPQQYAEDYLSANGLPMGGGGAAETTSSGSAQTRDRRDSARERERGQGYEQREPPTMQLAGLPAGRWNRGVEFAGGVGRGAYPAVDDWVE